MITLSLWTLLVSNIFANQLDSVVVQSDREISASESYENVIVLKGNLTFYGKADSLVLMGGRASLESGSYVKNLVLLRGAVEQKDGAEVENLKGKGDVALFDFWAWTKSMGEKVKSYLGSTFNWTWNVEGDLIFSILFFVFLFLTALLFLGLPGLGENTYLQFKSSIGSCFGVGILFSLSFIPVLLICIFSIVGILFIPFVFIGYIGFLWIGFFISAHALGRWLLSILRIKSAMISLIVGLGFFIFLLNVDGLAIWLDVLAGIFGVGAFLRSLFRGRVYMASV